MLVLLLVIAGLLVVADLTARGVAEEELAARLRAEVPEANGTSAGIHSFPFLGRLLSSGQVSQVDAKVVDVTIEGLRFTSIAVELHRVELNRDQLLQDRRVVLEHIERGEVRAEVGEDAISEALGVPFTLANGQASVEVAGQAISASLAVRDGRLVVGGGGLSLPPFELPTAPLLPCVADAEIVDGGVVLTCSFTEVPQELLTAAQTQL